MTFTAAGARGEISRFGGPIRRLARQLGSLPAPAEESRRIMSSFTGDRQGSSPAAQEGPVLVMPPPKDPKRSSLWMRRIWLIVFVLFCLEIGIILTALPWTRIWTENSLLLGHPQLREFLMHNFVRGLVSGLGLVDIWMGIAEAVRYREGPDA